MLQSAAATGMFLQGPTIFSDGSDETEFWRHNQFWQEFWQRFNGLTCCNRSIPQFWHFVERYQGKLNADAGVVTPRDEMPRSDTFNNINNLYIIMTRVGGILAESPGIPSRAR